MARRRWLQMDCSGIHLVVLSRYLRCRVSDFISGLDNSLEGMHTDKETVYKALGVAWATSLLGFVTVALLPIPWVLFKYGPKIRSLSQYDTIKA
jgi:hypothetical protein